MLILNVIIPALSFETTTLVMSGALVSSPVESANVELFAVVRAAPPNATDGSPTSSPPIAAMSRIFDLT